MVSVGGWGGIYRLTWQRPGHQVRRSAEVLRNFRELTKLRCRSTDDESELSGAAVHRGIRGMVGYNRGLTWHSPGERVLVSAKSANHCSALPNFSRETAERISIKQETRLEFGKHAELGGNRPTHFIVVQGHNSRQFGKHTKLRRQRANERIFLQFEVPRHIYKQPDLRRNGARHIIAFEVKFSHRRIPCSTFDSIPRCRGTARVTVDHPIAVRRPIASIGRFV